MLSEQLVHSGRLVLRALPWGACANAQPLCPSAGWALEQKKPNPADLLLVLETKQKETFQTPVVSEALDPKL